MTAGNSEARVIGVHAVEARTASANIVCRENAEFGHGCRSWLARAVVGTLSERGYEPLGQWRFTEEQGEFIALAN